MVRPDQRGRALRREPARRRRRRRGHHPPLLVLHPAPHRRSRHGRAGPAADRRAAGPTTSCRRTRRSASTTAPAPSSPRNDTSLFFMDYGIHFRGQNKDADVALLTRPQDAWFDHYLKGAGPKPPQGVTGITQTCPADAPSEGPFTAATWDELSPGEVSFTDEDSKTIAPAAGDPSIGAAFDPVADGRDRSTSMRHNLRRRPARHRDLPPPRRAGRRYTLLGSPTVIADITSSSPTSQIAARLLDVGPDGNQTLVARGLYRPDADGRQVFQLHPNGWKFEDGHVPKLELLPERHPVRPRIERPGADHDRQPRAEASHPRAGDGRARAQHPAARDRPRSGRRASQARASPASARGARSETIASRARRAAIACAVARGTTGSPARTATTACPAAGARTECPAATATTRSRSATASAIG